MEKNIEELNSVEIMKAMYKEILELKEKINNKTEEKVDKLEGKFDKLEGKFEGLEGKFDRLEGKFDGLGDEVKNIKKDVSDLNNKVDNLTDNVNKLNSDSEKMKEDIEEIKTTLDEHKKILDEHSKTLSEHTKILNKNTKKLEEHDERFATLENKTDKICKNLEDLGKTEKLHFEYTTNKFNRIEQKNDTNFKYLDEKIDTTKNNLISETTDILETFSLATTKSIKNIENKIDNEKNERILDIGQIKGLNDYNKIILRNLESRISILEEESEKYNLN